MKVLMLSTDRTIFDPASQARKRMEEYAAMFGKLSVIVFSKKGYVANIGEKLSLYPTNSLSRLFYIRDAAKIGKKLGAADVVTAQDPFETGLAARRIARSIKAPLHIQVHTDFLAKGFTSEHWPLNLLRTWMAGSVLKSASRIRAVSRRIKEKIEKTYHPKAPVSVLPIYVDIEQFSHVPRSKHPRFKTMLLVVSRLEKEKRIDMALQALKKARAAGIDAGLVIVGSGREEKCLKRLAKRLGLADWVEWPGFVSDLSFFYGIADVLLYPGALYEGFGMAPIEALAAGVPVVARDVGVCREAGAEIAEGDSEADFSDAALRFLQKPLPAQAVPHDRAHLLLYAPYASKEEYLKKLTEDLALSTVPS